jgi:hypothetical protein
MLIFYGEVLLSPRQTPKLEDSTLSSAAAYSLNLQVPSIAGGRPSNRNARTRRAVVTRGPK